MEKLKKPKLMLTWQNATSVEFATSHVPYGAIKVTLNGAHDLSILDKDSYPQLVRDIKADTTLCPKECTECEKACPLSLIKISKFAFDGTPVEKVEALSPSQKKRVQVNVDVQKDYCPTCKICELKCNAGALKTKKAFEGVIAIDQQKCPDSCTDCLDVCPHPRCFNDWRRQESSR